MISFVIPVYNIEKYIKRCVQSIVQSCKLNFEIIIVDDESTDHTRAICDEMMKIDDRIHYFWQNKSGVSAARNKGIDLATQKWIMFVDADDVIDISDESIFFLDEYDLIVCTGKLNSSKVFDVENSPEMTDYLSGILKISKEPVLNNLYLNTVWSKAYKAEVLIKNNIRFDAKLINGEDTLFNIKVLQYAKRIYIHNNTIYKWYISANSTTSKYQLNLEKTDKQFLQLLFDYFNQSGMMQYFRNQFYSIVLNGLWIVLFQSIGNYQNAQSIHAKIKRYEALASSFPYNEALSMLKDRTITVQFSRHIVYQLLLKKMYTPAFMMLYYATKKNNENKNKEYYIDV